jgi:hypothetical protein
MQVDPVTDVNGTQILPLPVRQPFTPNFQAYEVACEAARRAIMTAMSGSNLPTSAQRQNQKSGKALEQIDEQESRGTFHFIDNYNFALEQTGRVLNAWIPYVYDTKREVGIRQKDESHQVIRINDPDNMRDNGEPEIWDTTQGEHAVTISTGPSFESQRDEASQFVDALVSNVEKIAQLLPPGAAAKMLSLAIKLKTLGPIGDEIADVISPPEDKVGEQQQIAQGIQKLQEQQQVIQEMQAELQKLQLEKAGKVIDNEYKTHMAQMQNDIKVLVALIEAKNQNSAQEAEMYKQFWIENHNAAHETAMQSEQHAHDSKLAQQAQTAASQQSSQEHGQALEQQAVAAEQEPASNE